MMLNIKHFILIWIAFTNVVAILNCSISEDIYGILFSFYNSTQGNSWRVSPSQNPWIFPSPLSAPCGKNSWVGLTCNSCNITAISLSNMALKGRLNWFIFPLGLTNLILKKGYIPSTLGLLTSLNSLILNSNLLSGVLPSSLADLTSLQVLSLRFNLFTSSIPSSFSNLQALQILNLGGNFLSKSIPASLGLLTNLRALYLNSNLLSSTIPSSLGNLSSLELLFLDSNSLTNSIPSSLGHLSSLQAFYSMSNFLSKSVPSSFGDLSSIQTLYIVSNMLSGSIPSTLGRLSSLEVLSFYRNMLSKAIPSSLGSAESLQILALGSNELTGSIPSALGHLVALQALYIDSNKLTSSIPPSIGDLSSLQVLYLDSNLLTNSIPSSLGQLFSLEVMYLYSNSLSGSIPSTFQYLSSIQVLDLDTNALSGSISSQIGKLTSLLVLYLYSNSLSQFLPSSLGELSSIQVLDFDSNLLSSSLPSTLKNLVSLNVLDIGHNYITSLFCFDNVSLSNLNVLSFSSNCMDSFNFDSLCNVDSLNSLLANEVNGNCGGVSSFSTSFDPSFPKCLWDMPNLVSLQAIGNGMKAQISHIMNSKDLSFVALDSNRIEGKFPQLFSNINMTSLQLSFNKISGVLSSSFQMNLALLHGSQYTQNDGVVPLSLESNRLSGTLPPYVRDLSSFDVVSGNIFDCKELKDENDVNNQNYMCGSLTLTYVLWLSEVLFLMVAILVGFKLVPSFSENMSKFLSIKVVLDRFLYFDKIHWVSGISICLIATCFIFMYLLLNAQGSLFSTHTYCYGWSTTVACLHGWVIFSIVFVFVSGFSAFSYWFLSTNFAVQDTLDIEGSSNADMDVLQPPKVDSFRSKFVLWVLGFCGMLLLLLVNGAYIFVVSQHIDVSIHLMMSVFITFMKMTLQGFFPSVVFAISEIQSSDIKFIFELLLNIGIYLLSPVLVTMAIDINCFYYAIESTPVIKTLYRSFDTSCFSVDSILTNRTQTICELTPYIQSSSMHVPWIYSYQCASSIVVNYGPIILYSYLISALLLPVIKLSFLFIDSQTPSHCNCFLIGMKRMISSLNYVEGSMNVNRIKDMITRKMVVGFFKHLIMMLTFGIAVPATLFLIVFVLFVEMFLLRLQLSKMLILLSSSSSSSSSTTTSDPLICWSPAFISHKLKLYLLSCPSCQHMFWRYLPICYLAVALFWGIFYFDMVGDVSGTFYGILTVGIVEIGYGLLIGGIFAMIVLRRTAKFTYPSDDNNNNNNNKKNVSSIELSSII